jgi:C-terminal processing protease CtpA/Prc
MRTIILISVLVLTSLFGNAQQTKNSEEKFELILELAEKNICNPALLNTPEWEDFKTIMRSDSIAQLTGKEYKRAFNRHSEDLTFSHFYLKYHSPKKAATKNSKKAFELEEMDGETVVLKLRQFVADAAGMQKIVKEITAKGYENLIIDLRNNGGGTLDAAVVLARFLTGEPIDSGVYLTRKWFNTNDHYPSKNEISAFPYLMDLTYEGIQKINREPAFRVVLPPHQNPTFEGKVFVLTNGNTASTCEPVVDILKRKKVATVIGERTAGAMLSANFFRVNEEFSIFIPVADYLNEEGVRLDKKGVSPHIKTKSEEALNVALQLIATKKQADI